MMPLFGTSSIWNLRLLGLALIFSLFSACEKNPKLVPGEGFINVAGGKIWYRITGEGRGTPLLLLHGGPGVPGFYLNPLQALSKDRPVIFFDQLGCGRSDRITNDSLLTIECFVEQVESVRKALGINKFYLYGQSWGTILGMEYYLKYPGNIEAMILSSPALSIPMWLADTRLLVATLPDSVQEIIRINEQNETYESQDYQNAITIYFEHFVARKLPWGADMDSTFSNIGDNVYKTMWGPSEFKATGTLKDYDITGRLHEVKAPSLFICGEFDEARPVTVQYYQSLIPGSQFRMITNAGHLTMQDEPEQDIFVITEFLNGLK